MYLSEARFPFIQYVADANFIPVWQRNAYSVVASADFDGDGSCDIALRHTSGDLVLLYMQGSQVLGGLSVDVSQSWSVDGVGTENPASD